MPLIPLIATSWVVLAAFFVTLCRMAGRSDTAHAQCASGAAERVYLASIEIWRDAPELALSDLRVEGELRADARLHAAPRQHAHSSLAG
jgi:hypothetical protein